MSNKKSDIQKIRTVLKNVERELAIVFEVLDRVQTLAPVKDYTDVVGIEGAFDGEFMVCTDGRKFSVPANYAAKSRLVYGEKLKMFEDDGKTLFKQMSKAEKEKPEAVLNKKEGKWYAITKTGTYKVLDVAANFNDAKVGDKAVIILPKGNVGVPFAALEKILREESNDARGEAPKVEEPAKIVKKAPLEPSPEVRPMRARRPVVKDAVTQIAETVIQKPRALEDEDLR